MNERIRELALQANGPNPFFGTLKNQMTLLGDDAVEKFAELLVIEFMDVVKTTANELNEHYFREGCSEEEVLMRVNGALAVLGHIRERFKD